MLANFLSRLYHACWYIIAAIIITAAVCVTVIRLMLPQINDYKPGIETWISDRTGYQIALDHIDAHWEGWTPTLLLHGIQVMDKSGKQLLTTLDSASVTVNPYISLQQQDLTQLQITLAGPDLLITREPDGSIEFANLDNEQQQISSGNEFFAGWVLKQRSIAIENASITYVDKNSTSNGITLSEVNLKLRNSHTRTQINATASLPAEYGETLKISLDAFGDITSPEWDGRIYFEGNRIYPFRFLITDTAAEHFAFLGETPATIHAWSEWTNGRAVKLRGEIAAANIRYPAYNFQNTISSMAAAFSIDRNDPGFRSRLRISNLQSSHGNWQPAIIDIYREETGDDDRYRYIIESDYLKLDDVLPALQLINPDIFDEKIIRGTLANNRLIYDPRSEQQVYFLGDIQSLTISDEKNNAEITANGGTVSGTPKWGQLQFHAATLELSLPKLFSRILNFYELNGDFNWTFTDGSLLIETDRFETHTPHFETTGKGRLIIEPNQESPLLDLQLSNTNINLEQLVQYMPVTLYNDVRNWMNNALVSGEITRVDTLLRGHLHEFPFANMRGRFQAVADVRNAVVDYHPDWIAAKDLNAQFLMDNNRIEVTGKTGTIHNAQINRFVATIPDVASNKAGLYITGNVSGNAADARYIIDNSPLSESSTLAGVKQHDITGDLQLDLTMEIPFYDQAMAYEGRLQMLETRMQSTALGITLKDINGHINFSRDKIASDSLQAVYSGQPVTMGINTGGDSRLLLSLEGHTDSRFITSQLVHFFPDMADTAGWLHDKIKGETRWTASLVPGSENDTGIPGGNAMLTISSDLSGLNLLLPEPLGKGEEPAPLTISTDINDNTSRYIRIEYNNEVVAGISTSSNGVTSLERAEIALGSNARLFDTGNGIFIHGSTERLSLSDWQAFMQSLETGGDSDSGSKRNIQVDLQIASLEYLDQKFTGTDFRVNNLQPDLYITLEGNGINGKVILPDNLETSPVRATFSSLHLQDNDTETDNGTEIIDPRPKPALEMTVSDFRYSNYQLGEMNLATSRMPSGLSVDNISFTRPGMTINGSGKWVMNNELPESDFEFRLRADKLENMLSTFDYSVASIRDGKTKLDLQANWKGSPMDFSLADANGTLEMDIEKGQFLDIEPAAGRLFGLLSLQTLPRRLSLDFSDLFGKGFSFDEIEGTFTIESGNAYTNNLSMTGPSAYIQVSGRTGLVEKDYDQIVTVTPQFSDSLPVASALFGPIGVGVGAVLFLAGELFESIPRQIDKLLRYQYSVKGGWDDPVVERIQATTGATVDPYNSKAVIGE